MSDIDDVEKMFDDLDEVARLCVRLLGNVVGGLVQEFGHQRVFQALDILAHPDAQVVVVTMVQRTEGLIQDTADEVVAAYRRAQERETE